MNLIQLGCRCRGVLLGLLSHFCGLLNGIEKNGSGSDATSQARSRHKSYLNETILSGGHKAGRQFYLDNAVHRAMAGDAIEKDDRGSGALSICDAPLSTEGRGSL